ncbi:MAG: DUF2851 family protein [Bacteroidota bacterium]|nr:DUF2851 family protein [Bacteroidota bacterium]
MKEEFLHYLWKYRLYDPECLTDNEGNKISVICPGEYNRDSGPDFFNARILIADTEWAGNVEIHTKASHFDNHGHNTDHAFDNVILHVVDENDKRIFNARGQELLTVELKYDPIYFEKYTELVNNPSVVACQNEIVKLNDFYLKNWSYALLVERLQDKSETILKIYSETGNDWEETFYRILSRYFGFRINAEPFEMLAAALPFRIIRKHADNRFQIEALLFGASGMLDEGLFREAVSDKYYKELIREFRVLSAKYSIRQGHGWLWKFCRLRPANFPTVRISQLAAMLSTVGGLFSRTLECADIKQIKNLFEVEASPYWDNHYVFGKKTKRITKRTGTQAVEILLINAVIPVIFAYGRFRDNQDLTDKSLAFMEEIGPESNSIVDDWKSAGIEAGSAFETQALIQLTGRYCKKRRCLECRIGSKIISSGRTLINENKLILEP